MAKFLRTFASGCTHAARHGACSNLHISIPTRTCFQALSTRTLVTESFMRIDSHKQEMKRIKRRHGHAKDGFLRKLRNTVAARKELFLDDVLASIRFAETDDDLDLAVKASVLFHKQESEVRFHFGPVLMRQIYLLNNHNYAVKLLDNQEALSVIVSSGFRARAILSELLFKIERYDLVMAVNQGVADWSAVTCLMASALKMNTPEAYAVTKEAYEAVFNTAHILGRREAAELMAYISYLQNDPRTVFEVLRRGVGSHSWLTKQIKIMCYVNNDRLEDATTMFGSMTDAIVPEPENLPLEEQKPIKKLWFHAVVDALKDAVDKCDDVSIQERFAADTAKITEPMFSDCTLEEAVLNGISTMFNRAENRSGSTPGSWDHTIRKSSQPQAATEAS